MPPIDRSTLPETNKKPLPTAAIAIDEMFSKVAKPLLTVKKLSKRRPKKRIRARQIEPSLVRLRGSQPDVTVPCRSRKQAKNDDIGKRSFHAQIRRKNFGATIQPYARINLTP